MGIRGRSSAVVAASAIVLAGCGSGTSPEDQMKHARESLASAHAVSVTLRATDPDRSLYRVMTSGSDPATPALARMFETATIAIEVEAADGRGLGAQRPATTSLSEQIRRANLSLSIETQGKSFFALRIIDGILYGTANIEALNRINEASGDGSLTAGAPPEMAPVIRDLRAGKWLRLPLASYLDVFQGYLPPAATPAATQQVSRQIRAVITSAVVLDDPVAAGDAVNARFSIAVRKLLVGVFRALGGLVPAGGLPTPADVAMVISPHKVAGTLRVVDGHYRSVTVPLAEFAAIPAHVNGHVPHFGKSALVLEIDDSAPAITAPNNISSFRLERLFGVGG